VRGSDELAIDCGAIALISPETPASYDRDGRVEEKSGWKARVPARHH
jgi:hypothetical protein